MSVLWTVWTALVLVAVCALVLFVVGVRRTIANAGWGKGKLHRGPGAKWFWGAIVVAIADGVALAIFAMAFSA